MLQTVCYVVAGVLFAVGVVGCVVPVLPGPLAAYAGVLCLLGTSRAPGALALGALGLLAVGATVLDMVIPGWGAKRFRCSKWGVWGSVIGAIAGVFFFPWGLLAGPFLGALAGEVASGRRLGAAAWSGVGALVGFVCGVLLKLAVCGVMIWGTLAGSDWSGKASRGEDGRGRGAEAISVETRPHGGEAGTGGGGGTDPRN